MKIALTVLSLAGLAAVASPASAQNGDFNLTYHVERTPAVKLSLDKCASTAAQVARQSKLTADTQSFPGQLVTVKGGGGGAGAFVVQCIAVGTTTVTVVHGIDYSDRKGALGVFADKTLAAIKAAGR